MIKASMLGAILFALLFLLISEKTRAVAAGFAVAVTNWVDTYRPFSYLVLLIMAISAILAFILMAHWPDTSEPHDPLTQYKRQPPDMD